MAGEYIVIEGNDGTGKSTQVRELASYLTNNGYQAVIIEEPGSEDADKTTPVANYLRSVIKNDNIKRDPEINLALFSAARRELWQQKIEPALAKGAFVLAARSYLSTIAYQGAGEGLSRDHIVETTRLFTDERYMNPDKVVVLLLDDETERTARIAKRGQLKNPDTFESRDGAFQSAVNQAYREIANEGDLATIDCIEKGHFKSVEEIQQEVRSILEV